MRGFLFKSGLPKALGRDSFLAVVPARINTSKELLECLSRGLRFPDYFGKNWNALDECLADLSWLGKHEVTLWHEDVPLAERDPDRAIYLDCLRGSSGEKYPVRLYVVFPEVHKEFVKASWREGSKRLH
jgi:hypothetical protein